MAPGGERRVYPECVAAERLGAGVEAYARYSRQRVTRFRDGWLPG